MESKKGDVFIGIDLSARNTLLSIYKSNMEEPVTVSTVLGAENFSIPTYISKKIGMSQWYFGEEAQRRVKLKEAVEVDDLLNKAIRSETVFLDGMEYEVRELLVIFFKKLFSLPGANNALFSLEKLVICVNQVSMELMELLNFVAVRLDVDLNSLMIIDRRESFYYYALSQKPELFIYDVVLFDYSGTNLVSTVMKRNQSTRPQVITLEVENHGELIENQDLNFDRIVESVFGNSLISSVYLVGDGFDGEWMKESLTRLCKGRKVFLGKNLYSKGACFAGDIKSGLKDWPFIYIGDNDLKLNLSIKIIDGNDIKFFTLIDAGESWYEAKGECEVIIDGEPEVEFFVQRPDSREVHSQVLELTDMPPRENRTTRIRIEATPVSDAEVMIKIIDLGFGEIAPSSGKSWEHTISLN